MRLIRAVCCWLLLVVYAYCLMFTAAVFVNWWVALFALICPALILRDLTVGHGLIEA